MKKTLAIALVLVMVVSCLSVLFVSAAEVESLTVHFTQAAGTKTDDSTLTLFTTDIDSLKDAINWSTVILVDANGTIVNVAKNVPNVDKETGTPVKLPEGGFAIVFHGGDGLNTVAHEDLTAFVNDLAKAAGVEFAAGQSTTIYDVKSAGWTADKPTTEGGDKGFGSVTLYKGSNKTEEPKPEEPKDTVVEEKIDVDGKLNDTGYDRATWVSHGIWQEHAPTAADPAKVRPVPAGLEASYTVRADDENVYIAIKVNQGVVYKDDTYQTGATNFRIWVHGDGMPAATPEDDSKNYNLIRAFYDVTWNGKGFNTYLFKEATEQLTVVADTEGNTIEMEIAVKKSDLKVTDEFSIMVTYSQPSFVEKLEDGTEAVGYNAVHLVDVEELPESWSTKYDFYNKYKVADIKLDKYTIPADPDAGYKDKIAGLVGEDNADSAFDIELSNTLDGNVMTVTATIKNLKADVKLQNVEFALFYDTERMTLTTKVAEDEKDEVFYLDCLTKTPDMDVWNIKDSVWENLSSEELNEDKTPSGKINVRICTSSSKDEKLITKDGQIELTFTFELKADFKRAGVWVTSDSVIGGFAPAGNTGAFSDYVGNGHYTVAEVPNSTNPNPPTSGSSDPSTSEPPTGDTGIIVFAVLGILAIAGGAAVIKVRH